MHALQKFCFYNTVVGYYGIIASDLNPKISSTHLFENATLYDCVEEWMVKLAKNYEGWEIREVIISINDLDEKIINNLVLESIRKGALAKLNNVEKRALGLK